MNYSIFYDTIIAMIKTNQFLILVVTIFTLFSLLLVKTGVTFAQQNTESTSSAVLIEVKYQDINPKDGYKYSFKRLQEKIILLFSFSESAKINTYTDLLNRRLAELKYVVDNKDISNIQTVTQRYAQTAGEITNFTIQDSPAQKELTKKLLEAHLLVIMQQQKSFNDTTAEWRFLKHDEDYLKIYISQLQ